MRGRFVEDAHPVRSAKVETWSDRPSYGAFGKDVPIRRILVVKADHIGDLVLGMDAMLILRRAFPEAHFTLACAPWTRSVAQSLGLFDEIHPVNFFNTRSDQPREPFDPQMLNGLGAKRFDLAIDLRVDPDTRVILDHVDAGWKCGYESAECKGGMTFSLPHRLEAQTQTTLGQHQMMMLCRLAQSAADFFRATPDVAALLRTRLAQDSAFDLGFAAGRALVACNTASGREAKNWPLARFRGVLTWLVTEMDAAVLLVGSPDQARDADAIIAACPPGAPIVSAIGHVSLNEAIGLISRASLYLGNDTGLTHVAARLGIPTVAIYSGIDPTGMWAPVGPAVTVLKAPVACSPCHILLMEDCHHDHACILGIGEHTVRKALRLHLLTAPAFRTDQPRGAHLGCARPAAAVGSPT